MDKGANPRAHVVLFKRDEKKPGLIQRVKSLFGRPRPSVKFERRKKHGVNGGNWWTRSARLLNPS